MFAFMESNNIGVTHALFWMVRPSASPETTNFPPPFKYLALPHSNR
jgi:hypothetical protein